MWVIQVKAYIGGNIYIYNSTYYRTFVICEAFYSCKTRVLYRDSPKNFRSEKFLKSAVVCTRGINKIFNKIRTAWIQPLIGDDTNTGIEEETYSWLYDRNLPALNSHISGIQNLWAKSCNPNRNRHKNLSYYSLSLEKMSII